MSGPAALPLASRGSAALSGQRVALALMATSGFAALGEQIVWTQQAALWLGHEAAAVLAVVAAFFGGLGLGALGLGTRIARSARPGRWYGVCEAVIALWTLVLAVAWAPLSGAMLGAVGEQPAAWWQWSVAFAGTFCLLLPATAAMGATLPAIERAVSVLGRRAGSSVAALYAANTAGALLGVLATAFWLVPGLGLAGTALLCAGCNLACAALALGLPWPTGAPAPVSTPSRSRRPLLELAVTGCLGIGYEVLVVRVLSQVAEDTVYTFALLLAVYLAGTALGAAAYQRLSRNPLRARQLHAILPGMLAGACFVGLLLLYAAPSIGAAVTAALGPGMGSALTAEAVMAVAAFALPTCVMGALFSDLCSQAQSCGTGLGTALGVNTLGAALAPMVFGIGLAPVLGPRTALCLVVAGYAAVMASRRPDVRRRAAWGLGAIALTAALWLPPLAFVDVPPGGRLVSYTEGALAAVSVVEDAQGAARLRINNRQQEGNSATLLADGRQALLPMLLHPAPHRALFLGLGTGMTSATAARDPTLQVDVVELLPEVVAASAHFMQAFDGGVAPANLHVMTADARRYVRTTAATYDLIVSDNFHPARSGSGALYTVEHFRAVRERLAPGGLYCQWLPLHQLDLDTLRSIVRSFLAVYPDAAAVLATNSLDTPVLGLLGGQGPLLLEPRRIGDRLARPTMPQSLADYGFADLPAVLGSLVAGPAALSRFAGSSDLNTDDKPVVAYRAPRITYAPASMPRDRLLALLHDLDVTPGEVFGPATDASLVERLAAYRAARRLYLQAGRDVRPSGDAHAMLAQVGAPLLAVLRTSPDFRPAYDPLWRMARALAADDRVEARRWLTALAAVQPERPEAAAMLAQWDASMP